MKKQYCKPSFIVVKLQSRRHMLAVSQEGVQGMQATRESYTTDSEQNWGY